MVKSGNKCKPRSPMVHLLDTWLLLYKKISLVQARSTNLDVFFRTFSTFFHLICICFSKKDVSKFKKVAPEVNKSQNAPFSKLKKTIKIEARNQLTTV